MAYVLHHSTTFSAHGTGYHKMDESGQSPVGHGHSHMLGGHGNTSVRAAFIHVLGDLLQSIGVMVAAIIIYFWVSFMVPACNQITLRLRFSSCDLIGSQIFTIKAEFQLWRDAPFQAFHEVSSDFLSISARI